MASKATQNNPMPPKNKENSYRKITKYGQPPKEKQTKSTHSIITTITTPSTKINISKTHNPRTIIPNMYKKEPAAASTSKLSHRPNPTISFKLRKVDLKPIEKTSIP